MSAGSAEAPQCAIDKPADVVVFQAILPPCNQRQHDTSFRLEISTRVQPLSLRSIHIGRLFITANDPKSKTIDSSRCYRCAVVVASCCVIGSFSRNIDSERREPFVFHKNDLCHLACFLHPIPARRLRKAQPIGLSYFDACGDSFDRVGSLTNLLH